MKHKAIITFYKEPFQKSNAYESCQKYLSNNFEIIIIINGSVSNEVYKYHDGNKRVTVYECSENYGLRAFQKLNLCYTDQDFVLLLNPDCKFDQEFVIALSDAIEEDKCDVIVPELTCRGSHISPFKKFNCMNDFYIYAFTCVRGNILYKLEDVPDYFFVDGIDYFLSLEFVRLDLKIRNIGVTLEHNLAIAVDYKKLSSFRKKLIIESEKKLVDLLFENQPFKRFYIKKIYILRLKLAMHYKSLKSA